MLGKLGSKILPMLTSIFGQVKTKSHNTKTAIGDAIHYYKAVRRLIVLYISLIWLWMLQIAARMYVTEKILDAKLQDFRKEIKLDLDEIKKLI